MRLTLTGTLSNEHTELKSYKCLGVWMPLLNASIPAFKDIWELPLQKLTLPSIIEMELNFKTALFLGNNGKWLLDPVLLGLCFGHITVFQ